MFRRLCFSSRFCDIWPSRSETTCNTLFNECLTRCLAHTGGGQFPTNTEMYEGLSSRVYKTQVENVSRKNTNRKSSSLWTANWTLCLSVFQSHVLFNLQFVNLFFFCLSVSHRQTEHASGPPSALPVRQQILWRGKRPPLSHPQEDIPLNALLPTILLLFFRPPPPSLSPHFWYARRVIVWNFNWKHFSGMWIGKLLWELIFFFFFLSVHCAPPLEVMKKGGREGDKQKLMNKSDKQMGLSVSPKWGPQTITALMTRLLMSNDTVLSSRPSPTFHPFLRCLCFWPSATRFLSYLLFSVSPISSPSLTHLPPTTRTPPLFFQIIASLDEDPAAQSKQLTLRLQQIAAALENKVTDL